MISVIIPTLNENTILEPSLKDLTDHRGEFEVIVSDGGSFDRTPEIVRLFPRVKFVTSPRGRGRQMNEGAKRARGDIFLFLHADTLLPPSGFEIIESIMSSPEVQGGSFFLTFDNRNFALKIYSLFSRLNHILFTYGDQGLFVRRTAFNAIGGFRDIPIMEDVEIQVRLRRMGRFVKAGAPVVTSARRFIKSGIIRQEIVNIALVLLYHIGVPPSRLARFYRQ
jgi:rSAM/selenodomain-associated transferase 2